MGGNPSIPRAILLPEGKGGNLILLAIIIPVGMGGNPSILRAVVLPEGKGGNLKLEAIIIHVGMDENYSAVCPRPCYSLAGGEG